MQLRVRGPQGQATLQVEPGTTLAAFRARLEELTGVPALLQEVRSGFPPRPLAFPADRSAAVSSLRLQPGDLLTVTQQAGAAPTSAPAPAAAPAAAYRTGGPARAAPAAARAAPAAAAGSAAGSSAEEAGCCAYCFEPLPPFQRFHCLSCSAGGPGALWHACQACAVQRSLGMGGAPAGKRQRREGDASQPCFERGHGFAPVWCHGWLTLPPGPAAGRASRLERFLLDYQPWAAGVPGDLAWISVDSGRPPSGGAAHGAAAALASPEDRFELVQHLWAAKPAAARTAEAAQQIGRDLGILSGKWMVRTNPSDEAVVWAAVARAVYVQGLCHSAKIAAGPQGDRPHQQAGARVICVYTDDFGDREDAMRVHAGLSAALRAAMPSRQKWSTISYKPDIYTHLGLYYGNPGKIRPTIYSKKL